MEQQVGEFTRTVFFYPAYDKRDPDPSKNYGIHGMDLKFVLKGPKGATQFLVLTNMKLKRVREEMYRNVDTSKAYWFASYEPIGADIGYHSYTPQYEGQRPTPECDILGCPCYYDGSTLAAQNFLDTFLSEGEDAVWNMLEERYNSCFGETE